MDATNIETKKEVLSKEEEDLKFLRDNRDMLLKETWELLDCDNGRIKISKIKANEFDDYENKNNEMIKCTKLILGGGGDWFFNVSRIKAEYFKSREMYDKWEITHGMSYPNRVGENEGEMIEKISLEEAFDYLTVPISANMDAFRPEIVEKYLGYSVDIDLYLAWKKGKAALKMKATTLEEINALKMNKSYIFYDEKLNAFLGEIQSKILYKLMTEIFGDDDDENKCHMLTNFRILSQDGNDMLATACKGKYYLTFTYGTS